MESWDSWCWTSLTFNLGRPAPFTAWDIQVSRRFGYQSVYQLIKLNFWSALSPSKSTIAQSKAKQRIPSKALSDISQKKLPGGNKTSSRPGLTWSDRFFLWAEEEKSEAIETEVELEWQTSHEAPSKGSRWSVGGCLEPNVMISGFMGIISSPTLLLIDTRTRSAALSYVLTFTLVQHVGVISWGWARPKTALWEGLWVYCFPC